MTNGTTTWSYEYNADGLRTSRSNGTTTYEYIYNGTSLVQMTVGDDLLYFAYDSSSPMTVTYNGTVYYYVTNLQGDVIAILDSAGAVVVEYTYDAWGNILSTSGTMADTLGTVNPLRYRGYVYDIETGLYYLQSRYYNPEIGRFINADVLVSTGQGMLGNNMFAYCRNKPVSRIDVTGTEDIELVDLDGNPSIDEDDIVGGGGTSGTGNGIQVGTSGGNGGTGTGSAGLPNGGASSQGIPQAAWDTVNYVASHNGSPPPGYVGGRIFSNDGRNGGQILPPGVSYREYDIAPHLIGTSRDVQRVVLGSDGSSWYTNDHYDTFSRMG